MYHKCKSGCQVVVRPLPDTRLHVIAAPMSPQTATLLFTRCANSNGFCRCFAFQIGKICCHHDIIRHFQFRKCLPVYSNTATSFCFAHTSAHCRPHKFLRLSWCRCFFLLSCSLCLWRFVLRISVSSAIITAGTVTLFFFRLPEPLSLKKLPHDGTDPHPHSGS